MKIFEKLKSAFVHIGGKKPPSNVVIVIDSVFFQFSSSGIARVWRSLLREWSQTDFARQIVVVSRSNFTPRYPDITYVDAAAYDYGNQEAEREKLQKICDSVGASVFCSSYYTIPDSTPSVFMVYDMIPEIWAVRGGANLNAPEWRAKTSAIQHASSFIAISENSAHDLRTYTPDIADRPISIACCGCDFSAPNAGARLKFLQTFSIERPYFLIVGARTSYKNSRQFFSAFEMLGDERANYAVVCCSGESTFEDEFRKKLGDAELHTLRLSDEDLQCAYASALALVYPSEYEGFGMPLLEAMACRCPVITCATSSIPEVVGEAAMYVELHDVEGMYGALKRVQVPLVRADLVERGLKRAQLFSWKRMAQEVKLTLLSVAMRAP